MTSQEFWQTLSKLNKEDKVFELAALFMEVGDIASFIGTTAEEFGNLLRLHPENTLAIAYARGRLKTKIMLRFDALKFAISGSPDATKEMMIHMIEQSQSEQDA